MSGRHLLRRPGGLDGRDSARGWREGMAPGASECPHHDFHQPWGGAQGKASDIEITAKEILRLKEILNRILAEASGKTLEDVTRDTDRDHFMSAEEAKTWGLIDKVL